jgi:hypothetical protein
MRRFSADCEISISDFGFLCCEAGMDDPIMIVFVGMKNIRCHAREDGHPVHTDVR